ncbi:MAG: DUF6443 domain-containing protein [Thermodesulfobacteriota bacterium]
MDSCQYFDGLGRPTLAVRIGTEAGDTETKYITTRLRYDSMGRQYRVEGPYAARYQNGLLIPLTNSYPRVITYFDFRGRPTTVSRTDNSGGTGFRWLTTTFTYEGLSTTVEDADLRKNGRGGGGSGQRREELAHQRAFPQACGGPSRGEFFFGRRGGAERSGCWRRASVSRRIPGAGADPRWAWRRRRGELRRVDRRAAGAIPGRWVLGKHQGRNLAGSWATWSPAARSQAR